MAISGGMRRIGFAGHCRILAAVSVEQRTAADVADALGIYRSTVQRTLALAQRYGLAGRVAWVRPVAHSRLVPQYLLGGGDVSMPIFEEHARRSMPHSVAGSGALLLVTMLQLLRDEPLTRAELAEDLQMHIASIERMVSAAKAAGLIYVASWDRPFTGTSVARLAFGPGKDARRPPRKSNAPYQRAHRERRKLASQLGLLRAAA